MRDLFAKLRSRFIACNRFAACAKTAFRRLARIAGWSLAFILVFLPALAALVLQHVPLVDTTRSLTPEEIGRARAVLQTGLGLATQDVELNRLSLSADEMNATANYLLGQVGEGRVRFVLEEDTLHFLATWQPPVVSPGMYLNLRARAAHGGDRLALRGIRVGDLPLPVGFIEGALGLSSRHWTPARLYALADQAVEKLAVHDGQLELEYRWDAESRAKTRRMMTEITSKRRLKRYQAELNLILHMPGLGPRLTLGELLQPLATLARKRSSEHDPVEENRALFLVLSAYLSGKGNANALAVGTQNLPRKTVVLRNRLDLAKHFSISAALAAAGDDMLADAAGLVKEVSDSHGGSGFNFQDLAADIAGARMGELAVASRKSAKKLQKRLAANAGDDVLLPDIHDLPEHLDEEEFRQRFEGVGSAAFVDLTRDIEQRVNDLPLYRELGEIAGAD
jgi:hypothetical protein